MVRRLSRWQADHKPSAEHLAAIIVAIFRPNLTAVIVDDLLRDRQAETRMGAEFLATRPFGIEPLEDRREFAFGNARSLIVDRHDDVAAVAPRRDPDGATRRTERNGVGDKVAEDLDETAFDAG